MVTAVPLTLVPFVDAGVPLPPWVFPDAISGDCCGSRTMPGVQSEELWDKWRFEGRLVLRESDGGISGMRGVVGGVENVSVSGENMGAQNELLCKDGEVTGFRW